MIAGLRVTHVAVILLAVFALAGTSFLASPEPAESFTPVSFEDTLSTGLTGVDVRQAETAGWSIPRAEVFYAQYRYVVGYYGLAALVDAVGGGDTGTYGQPLAVYVTDYSGTDPRLTADGYIRLRNSLRRDWTRASDALFVVDSEARTPGGPAVLPFAERADARAFADTYGGHLVDWEDLQRGLAAEERSQGVAFSEQVTAKRAWANRTVSRTDALRDRPVSVVVGQDAASLAAAVERAPPNSTIRLPPGVYEGNLTVRKPVTISGAGNRTVLDGGGTGTVLTLRSPGVSVTDCRIEGVGDRDLGSRSNQTGNASGWDRDIRLIYGRGDAAIRTADAPGSLISNVTIETPANGIVLLNTSHSVVANVTVNGTERWEDGFMGVLPMHSRVVVQDSTVTGGRDGVYTHYANDLVIRRNEMQGMRYGVHEMYTSGALVADNHVRDVDVGIIVMTRPAGNLLLGNDIRHADIGLSVAGSTSLVAENILAANDIGLSVGTDRSLVTRNTVVRNRLGVRDDTLVPTNDVTENDILANERAVDPAGSSRDLWAVDGRGNYWGAIPGRDRTGDGIVDRPYRPTDAVDAAARDAAGAAVLARSPAVTSVRRFQRAVPGLRRSGIVDPAPFARPVRPGVLEAMGVNSSG